MSTDEKIDQILNEMSGLKKEVIELRGLVIRDKVKDPWIPEKDAAALCNYDAENFRRKVKASDIDVRYRNDNGRKWEYHEKDILRYKEETSTMI